MRHYCASELRISIHVPAWGTTRTDWWYVPFEIPFQSTFPRGERPIHISPSPSFCNFNPRSRVGNDGLTFLGKEVLKIFQSTFPRGERLQISTIFHLYICISSTNSHFSITSFCIFYLIHFFLICFFQLFMVRIFWGFSVYFWFALYRNNT